ncbi:MAG: hypothetical protein ACI4VP_05645 [Clostridia bacterium]
MKNRGLLSLILTICMVLLLTPTVAYAEEVKINDGELINVRVLDNSVDASSISVDLFVIFRNKETGEEQPLEGIDTITPENVTIATFETIKTNAIEDAKTKLNEWLEIMRQANPDVQFTVVGDMDVKGNDVDFDNRTYTMKSDGNDDIIIGDEASGSTTNGSQTTSRYMEVNGDYGKKGNYSVTMTVEVQAVGKHTLTIVYNDGECNTEFEIKAASTTQGNKPDGTVTSESKPTIGEITNPQTGDNIIMFIIIFALALTGILATCIISKKRVKNNK